MSWLEPERLAPGEARLRIELLVERVVVLDLRARQRREVARADVGHAIVGPAVGGAEVAVGQPDLLRQRVHLPGEGLLGPGDAFGQHDRRVVARQSHDAVEEIFDADLLARSTGTWSIRPRARATSARSRAAPCTSCSSASCFLSISSNATSTVIILAIDAGGMRASAFFA